MIASTVGCRREVLARIIPQTLFLLHLELKAKHVVDISFSATNYHHCHHDINYRHLKGHGAEIHEDLAAMQNVEHTCSITATKHDPKFAGAADGASLPSATVI
jgi:hypothetical protein